MSSKFKKRDIERKGDKKETEKDMKLVKASSDDLAHPEELQEEYESKTTPINMEEKPGAAFTGPPEGT